MIRLNPVDAKRSANMIDREYSGGSLNHLVEFHPRQFHPLMQDCLDLETVLQQIGKKFLAGNGIIGQVIFPVISSFLPAF